MGLRHTADVEVMDGEEDGRGGNRPVNWHVHRKRGQKVPERDQLAFFNCFDSCHKSRDSGERQYESKTCKRRFYFILRDQVSRDLMWKHL